MLKSKLYQKLLVAGITGSLLISSGVLAFAATSKSAITSKSVTAGKFSGGHMGEGKGFMQKGNPLESVLKTEVTAGVITQDESDKITAFLKTKEDAQKTARDTERAKYDAMTDAEKKAAKDAKKVEMNAEKAKLAAMTDAEKKVYFEANKPAKTDVLAELVTAGLLTQAQSDTIKAAMPQRSKGEKEQGNKSGFGMQQGNPLASILKTEVTAGVITQEISDNVTAFIKTKEDAQKVARDAEKAKYDAMTDAEKKAAKDAKKVEMDAEKAKLAAMTDAEKKVYFEANKPAKVSILSELVTAGILTQDQADKLQAAMPQRPEMGKGRGQK